MGSGCCCIADDARGADQGVSGREGKAPRKSEAYPGAPDMVEQLAFGFRADTLPLARHHQRKRRDPQSRSLWKSRPLSQRALEDLNLWPSDS